MRGALAGRIYARFVFRQHCVLRRWAKAQGAQESAWYLQVSRPCAWRAETVECADSRASARRDPGTALAANAVAKRDAHMTTAGFVIANLFRRKGRTTLTLLSIITAFLLFGLLQAVNVLFDRPADFIGITRLITQARVSVIQPLPIRLLPQIRSVQGVKDVAWVLWL